jgi:hypothetical protein
MLNSDLTSSKLLMKKPVQKCTGFFHGGDRAQITTDGGSAPGKIRRTKLAADAHPLCASCNPGTGKLHPTYAYSPGIKLSGAAAGGPHSAYQE